MLFDLRCRSSEARLRIDAHLIGADDIDIVDTDKSKHLLQVTADKVYRAMQWCTTGGNDDIDPFAFEQTFGSICAIAESDTGTTDHVYPGLQCCRNAEVVHRRGQHDMVGPVQLRDQLIGKFQACRLISIAFLPGGEVGCYPVTVDKR